MSIVERPYALPPEFVDAPEGSPVRDFHFLTARSFSGLQHLSEHKRHTQEEIAEIVRNCGTQLLKVWGTIFKAIEYAPLRTDAVCTYEKEEIPEKNEFTPAHTVRRWNVEFHSGARGFLLIDTTYGRDYSWSDIQITYDNDIWVASAGGSYRKGYQSWSPTFSIESKSTANTKAVTYSAEFHSSKLYGIKKAEAAVDFGTTNGFLKYEDIRKPDAKVYFDWLGFEKKKGS